MASALAPLAYSSTLAAASFVRPPQALLANALGGLPEAAPAVVVTALRALVNGLTAAGFVLEGPAPPAPALGAGAAAAPGGAGAGASVGVAAPAASLASPPLALHGEAARSFAQASSPSSPVSSSSSSSSSSLMLSPPPPASLLSSAASLSTAHALRLLCTATHDPHLLHVVWGVLWARLNDVSSTDVARVWLQRYKALGVLLALLRGGSPRVHSLAVAAALPLLRFLMHPTRQLAVRAGAAAERLSSQADTCALVAAANALSRGGLGGGAAVARAAGPLSLPGLALTPDRGAAALLQGQGEGASALAHALPNSAALGVGVGVGGGVGGVSGGVSGGSAVSPLAAALLERRAARVYLLLASPRRWLLERALASGVGALSARGRPLPLPLPYPLMSPAVALGPAFRGLPEGWVPTPGAPAPPPAAAGNAAGDGPLGIAMHGDVGAVAAAGATQTAPLGGRSCLPSPPRPSRHPPPFLHRCRRRRIPRSRSSLARRSPHPPLQRRRLRRRRPRRQRARPQTLQRPRPSPPPTLAAAPSRPSPPPPPRPRPHSRPPFCRRRRSRSSPARPPRPSRWFTARRARRWPRPSRARSAQRSQRRRRP